MPEEDFDIYGEDEGYNASANAQVGKYCFHILQDTSG
jgi:hypothetical protein